jgi:hypothetical protein
MSQKVKHTRPYIKNRPDKNARWHENQSGGFHAHHSGSSPIDISGSGITRP